MNEKSFLINIFEQNEIRKKKLETIFGSLSFTMDERIRQESIISDPQRWRIVPLIAKVSFAFVLLTIFQKKGFRKLIMLFN
jgi:hypothetical protein